MGKRGQNVMVTGDDEEGISQGVYNAYNRNNLRYSQVAPLTMYQEKNTGSNLPAQIDLFATKGNSYKFQFMAKVKKIFFSFFQRVEDLQIRPLIFPRPKLF